MIIELLKLGKAVVGSIDSAGALFKCDVRGHLLNADSALVTVKGTPAWFLPSLNATIDLGNKPQTQNEVTQQAWSARKACLDSR